MWAQNSVEFSLITFCTPRRPVRRRSRNRTIWSLGSLWLLLRSSTRWLWSTWWLTLSALFLTVLNSVQLFRCGWRLQSYQIACWFPIEGTTIRHTNGRSRSISDAHSDNQDLITSIRMLLFVLHHSMVRRISLGEGIVAYLRLVRSY